MFGHLSEGGIAQPLTGLESSGRRGSTTCNVCVLNLLCKWAVLSGWNLGKTVLIGVDNQFQSIRHIQLIED
jgi:hypothetical protein